MGCNGLSNEGVKFDSKGFYCHNNIKIGLLGSSNYHVYNNFNTPSRT